MPASTVERGRAAPAQPDGATKRAMDALRRVVRALSTSAHGLPGRHGVSGAQLFVMRQLAAMPGCSVGELARRTLAGQSTISGVVARLVQRGFIARVTSTEDARQAVLTLTPKGRRAIVGAKPTAQERLAQSLETLSPAQRESLAQGLEAWLAEAGLTEEPITMFLEERPTSRGRGAAKATRPRSTR